MLCARNEVKLQSLAKELGQSALLSIWMSIDNDLNFARKEASNQVKTISVVLDFANPDHPGWEALKEKVSPLDVGVLGELPDLISSMVKQ